MTPSPRDAILVHGLWMPGLAMAALARRLARAGYRPHLFSYAGRGRPLAMHAERLARFAAGRTPQGAHFIGHSLGGLVILEALQAHPLPVGRVVLLGTPARGCQAARRLGRAAFGRWMLGESAPLWTGSQTACWSRPEPLGVIAGSLAIGLGRVFGALPAPSDGITLVEEARVEGMRERIVLPVAHSAMLVSARVAAQTLAFLGDGRFAPARP